MKKIKKLFIRIIDWFLLKINKAEKQFIVPLMQKEEIREKIQIVKNAVKKYDYRKGRLVWNSRKLGTYVRSKHGTLK